MRILVPDSFLFGIYKIGRTPGAEALHVVGPGGLDFIGALAALDHRADIAAADKLLEEAAEKFSPPTSP